MVLGLFVTGPQGQSRENTNGRPQFKAAVDLVPLDICVRDASGQFVPDLYADDFLVLENGKPQQAAFLVPSGAVPLNAVLLIDMSHSMYGPKLNRALEAAQQFATLLTPGDRLEVIAFNHHTTRLHGFGDDPAHAPNTLASSMGAASASRRCCRSCGAAACSYTACRCAPASEGSGWAPAGRCCSWRATPELARSACLTWRRCRSCIARLTLKCGSSTGSRTCRTTRGATDSGGRSPCASPCVTRASAREPDITRRARRARHSEVAQCRCSLALACSDWPPRWSSRSASLDSTRNQRVHVRRLPPCGPTPDAAVQWRRDAAALYDTLEREVVPLFFDRDETGLPRRWIQRMKHSIVSLGWRFNADRMVMDYVRRCYLPAAGGLSSGA
jgi:hypothetical protein